MGLSWSERLWHSRSAANKEPIMTLILYGAPLSPFVRKAEVVLREKEIPFESESVNILPMPDWFKAIDRAYANLKPGGTIGVADFYVSRKWPAPGMKRHSGFTRHFWRTWFSWDNVFLSPDHLAYLQSRFETLHVKEGRGKIPYLLGLSAPYYVFVGRKANDAPPPLTKPTDGSP